VPAALTLGGDFLDVEPVAPAPVEDDGGALEFAPGFLRSEHLHQRGEETYLDIGTPALPIPPKLAALLRQLADDPAQQPRIKGAHLGPGWHFPGLLPGRPAGPSAFSGKLLEHGIDPRPARNGALVALVADIPPPILADLLGLHVNTTVRWAGVARRDWTDYLAARAAAAAENLQARGSGGIPHTSNKRASHVASFFQQVNAAARATNPRKLWPLRS